MFNAAIVGFGAWGRRLVASVQGKSERIRFTAGVTRTPARVQAFADSHGIRVGSDLGAALADRTVDGVVVVGPAGLHAEHAMAAIDAGKPVLVIKPFALRRADAEAMRAAAATRGVLVALGYDRCFSPAMTELRRRVGTGDLGRIVHAEGNFCVDRYMGLTPGDWKTDVYRAQPGSIADHMLYTMIELLGPVERVSVQALHRAAEIDIADTVSAVLRFADGTSGALTAIGVTSTFERLHLFGTKGWAEVRNNTRFEFRPLEGAGETIDFPPFDALRQELEVFAAAASGEMPFPVTPENAVAGVAALEAIARSGLTGQPVTL